jgi:hypothetical protein
MDFTYALGDGVVLQLERAEVERLVQELQKDGWAPAGAVVARTVERLLDDDSPLWSNHSGGAANHVTPPEWDEGSDLPLAIETYGRLKNKVRVFMDLLIDHPGQLLSVDEICAAAPTVFASDRSIAGSLNGFLRPCRDADRRFPFYWWENRPTDYAMKESVARLFAAARDEVRRQL